jgi:ribosomal protein L7/L12
MATKNSDIRELVRAGKKAEAIQQYQVRNGVELAEATEVIDRLFAGEPVFPPPFAQSQSEDAASMHTKSDFLDAVDVFLKSGRKVQAIKLYREYTALGLKEAKAVVDAREDQLNAEGHLLKSGCFIATAAFGAEDASEVLALRHFRDAVLAQNAGGRRFIRGYYRWSPPLADWLAGYPILCAIARLLLRPLAWVLGHKGGG